MDDRAESPGPPARDTRQTDPPPDTNSAVAEETAAIEDAIEDTEAALPPGRLLVNVVPWASIYVDDDSVGVSPFAFQVAAGTRIVELRNPEFPTRRFTVDVQPGQNHAVDISLWESVSRLVLEVTPWAQVWVDGEYRDDTPLDHALVLLPGARQITLRHPSLGEKTVAYVAVAGAADTLRASMR